MAPTKWTNSSLMTNQNCGERYRRIYEEREWRPSSARQARGRVVHHTVGRTLLRKMETHELPSLEEVRDIAADAFEREWADNEIALQPEERELGEPIVRAHSKDFSIALSGLHRTDVAPNINPIGVERRITVKPQDMDIEIEGTIDLVDGHVAGDIIRDTKTSEKSPAKSMAEDSQQLTMYGLLRRAETGRMPVAYGLDVLVRTPARGDLKYVSLVTMRDHVDLTALVSRLNASVDAVSKGVFVPASESWWGCSPAYCEFWDSCVYTRRGARPQS